MRGVSRPAIKWDGFCPYSGNKPSRSAKVSVFGAVRAPDPAILTAAAPHTPSSVQAVQPSPASRLALAANPGTPSAISANHGSVSLPARYRA
jgi:hypothetical protein